MKPETFKKQIVPLRDKLLNITCKLLQDSDDAEDIIQETFLKLWAIRDKLDAYDSVEALAVQIAKNKALDRIKAKKTERFEEENKGIASETLAPDKVLEQLDAVEIIRQIVQNLPLLQQETIRMKDIEGYEIREIAEITGTQVETVRVNLSRARKKVRDKFMEINNARYEN
jgi:RNA polymerase sigma factor, sigma-70 family